MGEKTSKKGFNCIDKYPMSDDEVNNLISKVLLGNERDDNLDELLLKYSTVELCKGMRQYLCDPQFVDKAMELLVTITSKSPKIGVELFFVVQFVCNINSETPIVSVRHIHPLIEEVKKKKVFCDGKLFTLLFEKIIEKIDIKRLSVDQRRKVFDILVFILSEENVRACSDKHLNRLLVLFDSERSPDLVVTCFKLVKRLSEFADKKKFASVSGSFFSFIAAYFPIVFSQPPGSKVSKKDLQDALLECMRAPAFTEFCLPFLVGKIVSPSLNVKCEVLRTLSCCVASAEYVSTLQMREIVNVVKGEALALINNRESINAFLQEANEIMEVLGRRCSSLSSEDMISVFDGLVEGKAMTGTMYERTQLHATFFFHVLKSSWNCCVELGVYSISTVVGLSLGGFNSHEFITLSAVFTSIVDQIIQEKPDLLIFERKIERIKPLVIDLACNVSESLCVNTGDDFEKLCQAEFLTAFLKFQYHLGGWSIKSKIDTIMDALLQMTLQYGKISQRINKILCPYVALDWDSCKGIVESYARRSVTDENMETLLLSIGCSSGAAAELIVSILLSDVTGIHDRRAKVFIVRQILSGVINWSYSQGIAILEVLRRSNGNGMDEETVLSFLMKFFSKAPLELCDSLSNRLSELPGVEAVALLCAGKVQKCQIREVSLLLLAESFVEQLSSNPVMARNGLIGCFIHFSQAVLEEKWGKEENIDISLCLLWALLLSDRHTNSAPSLIKTHLGVLFRRQTEIFERVLASHLTFVPLLSSESGGEGHNAHDTLVPSTLLVLIVEHASAVTQCLGSEVTFWTVVQRFLSQEREAVVRSCGSSVIQLLQKWIVSQSLLTTSEMDGSERVDILPVLIALYQAGERSSILSQFLVEPMTNTNNTGNQSSSNTSSLVDGLLEGLKSRSLHTRCTVLNILCDVGDLVSGKGENDEAGCKIDVVVKSGLKAQVLRHTLSALSDHKRKVRQAAARCRHVWFLVK